MTIGNNKPSFEGAPRPGYADRLDKLHIGYGAAVSACLDKYPETARRVLVDTGVMPAPEQTTPESPAPAGPLMQTTVENPGA